MVGADFKTNNLNWAVYIVASTSLAGQLLNFLRVLIGEIGLVILIGLILIGIGLAFLIFTIRNQSNLINLSLKKILK